MVIRSPGRNGLRTETIERPRPASGDVDWSLLSAQGKVLFYIALRPSCIVQEMAIALSLTERAVWGIIRDLRHQDMLLIRRDNRRHRYSVNLDAPLLHPTIAGLTLRPVLGQLAAKALDEPNLCVRVPRHFRRHASTNRYRRLFEPTRVESTASLNLVESKGIGSFCQRALECATISRFEGRQTVEDLLSASTLRGGQTASADPSRSHHFVMSEGQTESLVDQRGVSS